MSIFDMGKNLKDEPFSIVGWSTNKDGGIKVEEVEPAQFTGNFKIPKKRGRPKMDEVFFYDPYEKSTIADMSGFAVDVGDVVKSQSSGVMGYVTQVTSNTMVKINWQIIYKE